MSDWADRFVNERIDFPEGRDYVPPQDEEPTMTDNERIAEWAGWDQPFKDCIPNYDDLTTLVGLLDEKLPVMTRYEVGNGYGPDGRFSRGVIEVHRPDGPPDRYVELRPDPAAALKAALVQYIASQ